MTDSTYPLAILRSYLEFIALESVISIFKMHYADTIISDSTMSSCVQARMGRDSPFLFYSVSVYSRIL